MQPESSDDADSFSSARSSSPVTGCNPDKYIPPHIPRPQTTSDIENDTVAPRFSHEEESEHVQSSNETKSTGNAYFARSAFAEAIQSYDRALAQCPSYLEYEIAVLRSNIAACHIKLQEWKQAVESASAALEGLDRVDPSRHQKKSPRNKRDAREEKYVDGKWVKDERDDPQKEEPSSSAVQEIDDEMEQKLSDLERTGHNLTDLRKLRVKALMRRAKARGELGGWADLSGAMEDYKELVEGDSKEYVSSLDIRNARAEIQRLGPKLEQTKQKEMAEMMGKLKDLGNGLLKPFGLSTDMFKFQKDEKTGGYSMNIDQQGGK